MAWINPDSTASRAIALLQKNGPMRSGPLAQALGIDVSHLGGHLQHYVRNGRILVCKVECPGRSGPPANEYRLSVSGRAIAESIAVPAPVRTSLVVQPRPMRDTSAPNVRPTPVEALAPAPIRTPRGVPVREAPTVTPETNTPAPETKAQVRETPAPVRETPPAAPEALRPKPVKRAPARKAPIDVPPPKEVTPMPTPGFRCAIASDGTLLLMRDGEAPHELTRQEARCLVDYLRHFADFDAPPSGAAGAVLPALLATQAQ